MHKENVQHTLANVYKSHVKSVYKSYGKHINYCDRHPVCGHENQRILST